MSKRNEAFEASLTPEGIAAPTYLEWSDETLARAVREVAQEIHDVKGDDGIMGAAAAAVLIQATMKCNATRLEFALGDAKVTVEVEP